ncbi:hypothetical protein [Pelomonas cellulosilytica]|uniref:Uncharacterized protein n=1 Tax=Pelomonas cellulosilytica TaxID=2906762 RepID=A0ABS8XV54_9BURK|nr:hypothetical protein [Pelomonas sp. P8]MCE4554772.1 hypothetical protein [Pelomonas sp. P8]
MSGSLVGLWLMGSMAAVQASPGPQPTIAQAPINLAPLQTAEQSTAPAQFGGVLVITVRDEKRDPSKPLVKPSELKEALVVPSSRTKVEFDDAATEIKSDDASTDWAFTFKVSGIPAGLTLTRYVKFNLGQTVWQMPFAVTAPGPEAITVPEKWSVKPWPTNGRALEPDEGVPLFIAVPAQAPRAALKVVSFDLVEQSTKKTTVGRDWRLCDPLVEAVCGPIEFTKFSKGMHEVRLRPPANGNLDPGKYDGVLVVSSEGAPDGVVESVSATLYATSAAARALGFAAVVAGVLISTVGISFGRRWVDRKRLMIPAAVLQESVKNLQAELTKTSAEHQIDDARTKPLRSELSVAYGSLSAQQLSENGLPSSIPNPWVAIDTAQVEQLKSYIDAQALIILRLQVIIQRGVVGLEALRKRYGRLTAEAQKAYEKAYEDLALLAKSTTLDSNAVAQRVDDVIANFQGALEPQVRGREEAFALFSAGIADALPTPEHLRLRVKEGTFLVWALVVFVTVGVGTHLLILSNPGFGTLADELNCLFWGLGLGTGAAALGINVSSVLTGFNVTR